MSELIAFYGGTFSPPHIGHIHAVRAFAEYVKPDKLLIIPTAIPPHKQSVDGASDEERLEMCRLAFHDIPGAEISDLELRRGGKSYTADTIAALSADGDRVAMLIGTDMLLTLDSWYHPEYIFAHADLYCIRREDDPEMALRIEEKNHSYLAQYGKSVCVIPARALPLSSTMIREAIATGMYREYLPPDVAAYIEERRLYRQ